MIAPFHSDESHVYISMPCEWTNHSAAPYTLSHCIPRVCVPSRKRYIPLILENFLPNIKTQRIWPKHLHHPFLLALSVMMMLMRWSWWPLNSISFYYGHSRMVHTRTVYVHTQNTHSILWLWSIWYVRYVTITIATAHK